MNPNDLPLAGAHNSPEAKARADVAHIPAHVCQEHDTWDYECDPRNDLMTEARLFDRSEWGRRYRNAFRDAVSLKAEGYSK